MKKEIIVQVFFYIYIQGYLDGFNFKFLILFEIVCNLFIFDIKIFFCFLFVDFKEKLNSLVINLCFYYLKKKYNKKQNEIVDFIVIKDL